MEFILSIIYHICFFLCWIAPFTFVFSLLRAVKDIVNDGDFDYKYAYIAAISLLVIVCACVLGAIL